MRTREGEGDIVINFQITYVCNILKFRMSFLSVKRYFASSVN